MPHRFRIAVIVVLGSMFAVLVWGVGIEPRLIAEMRYRVRLPDLPSAWAGKEVAFIADLQFGMFLGNTGTVRRIIDRLIEERPALVLIGGDFIYHPTEDDSKLEARAELEREDMAEVRALIEQVTGIVRALPAAGIPTYAVLGNHDYAMQNREALQLPWVAASLEDALEQIGIPVLQNEALPLSSGQVAAGNAPLYLVGIGAHYPDNDHLQQAFSNLPQAAPRLVVMHNPQSFAGIPAGQAPLAVAGHTHGGQIRIPFLPSWSWIAIVREGEVHSDGWIHDFGAAGNRLYVNRGIGFSKVPIRINCLPEVTLFTLE